MGSKIGIVLHGSKVVIHILIYKMKWFLARHLTRMCVPISYQLSVNFLVLSLFIYSLQLLLSLHLLEIELSFIILEKKKNQKIKK